MTTRKCCECGKEMTILKFIDKGGGFFECDEEGKVIGKHKNFSTYSNEGRKVPNKNKWYCNEHWYMYLLEEEIRKKKELIKEMKRLSQPASVKDLIDSIDVIFKKEVDKEYGVL